MNHLNAAAQDGRTAYHCAFSVSQAFAPPHPIPSDVQRKESMPSFLMNATKNTYKQAATLVNKPRKSVPYGAVLQNMNEMLIRDDSACSRLLELLLVYDSRDSCFALNIQDCRGFTALHWAASLAMKRSLRILLVFSFLLILCHSFCLSYLKSS